MAKTQKIEVQGLIYETPPVPPIKTIRGSELKRKDQVWHRREEYLQWSWNLDPKQGDLWFTKPAVGQMEWYEAEINRIQFGDWIMINGEPVYFNRYAYFFMQWFVLQESIYPAFKDVCLEYFRFYEICENETQCLGDCGIKGRRVGMSSMSASIKLQIGILESNTLQGIVSKTGVDAQEMYFMVKNGLENLPEFLMPDLNKVTESEIHVAKPAKKISTNNTKASADKGRNNRINWLDTAENAYDGRRVRHVTIDEAAKWVKVNVQTCFGKISKTLTVGASVIGHISIFSTVNKGDKGGDNFRAIWDGSDHVSGKKDTIGQTVTGLKRFFLPSFKGFFGYIGKYGESIIENPTPEQIEYLKTAIDPTTGKLACPNPTIGAKQFLEDKRKMLSHDPELLADFIREYPFEWQEVFKGANNQCHFNVEELNNQIERVEEMIVRRGRNPQTSENGRRGHFKKADNGHVSFVDSEQGMWYILELLDPQDSNKSTFKGSVKCPDNTAYGAAGLDTFANARTTIDKGSDACCIIFKRYNPLDPFNSGMPVAMFIGRPNTKQEFHNQVFWALEYYGIKMLAERSPTDWEDYAVEKFLATEPNTPGKKHGYLITTPRTKDTLMYGISPQTPQDRESHLTEMVEYALNNMDKILFIRILRDMLKFNIKERTDYDAAMAFGYSLMALKEKTKPIQAKESGIRYIKTYRLSG